MKRQLIILTTVYILSSCSNVAKQTDKIKLSTNGDTLEVIKCYPSDSIREIIYYNNNRPKSNIGFYENGDTIKKPDIVFVKSDTSIFAYIPKDSDIYFSSLLIGLDSAKWENPYYRNIKDSTEKRLKKLKGSVYFKYNIELITDNEILGVFQCKMHSDTGTYKYYPFKVKTK